MDRYYLTAERLEELQKELESLKSEKRQDVAEQLKKAKEYGDLSENAEYAEAREEQSRVETRIFELENILKNAVVITKGVSADVVQIGSKITLKKQDGKVITYFIVGSNESKPEEGKISNESPIGKAVLNHKTGDTVTVATPAGQTVYQITKIE